MTAPNSPKPLQPSMEDLIERSAPRNPWRPTLAVLAVLAIVGLIVYAVVQIVSPSPTSRWRTAEVETHDVASAVTGVASIEPVSEASVAFPVTGTVRTVDVTQGVTVEAGQRLATLDTTSFEAAVHTKQAALASAQLDLQKALDAQAAAGDAASTTTTTSGGGGGGTPLQRAQQAVVSAQHQVDTAIAAADLALGATAQPCTSPSTTQQIGACQSALQRASSAQARLATAQQELAKATSHLDALLNQQAGGGGGGGGGSTTTTTAGGNTTTTQGFRPNTPTTTVPSAADVAVLQAKVDAAQAAVTVAEQNVLQTVIVSPIAGKVVAVNVTVGQNVTANATSTNIVVQGTGGFEATMSVSVDQVPNVRINQNASVLPDGDAAPISGRVAQISLAPTTGTTTTYRVTISLDASAAKLHNGTVGAGSIITAVATGATAVPTSAIHLGPSGRTVEVLDGTTVSVVPVEVGVIGDDLTQIMAGVDLGQLVVLADLDQPLPGTATKTSTTAATNQQSGQFPPGGFNGGGQAPGGGNVRPPGG